MAHLRCQAPTDQAASHEDNAPVLAGRLPPTVMSAASGCVGAPPFAVARSGAAGGGDADPALGAGGGPGGQQVAAGHPQAAVAGDPDPAGQNLVAGPLDLVQDAAVQLGGDLDTGPGGGGQQADAGGGGGIVGPGPLDLEGQQLGDRRGGQRGGQVGPADPEALQVLGGEIDQVLADVADEVGELEGQAELAGVLPGGRRVRGLQDRGHHGSDHRRRPLHVATQVVVGAVAGGG